MDPRISSRQLAAYLLATAIFLLPPPPLVADPPPPLVVVQSGTDRVLQIIKTSLSGECPDLRHRREEILVVVDEYFDFGEMARRALGRPWKDQPREKQQEFAGLFKQLLFNAYVSRIEETASPVTRIACDRVTVDGEYSIVKTRAVNDKTPVAEIEYKLRLESGGWKVYDVVVEGISLVGNYREQFDSILSGKSFGGLLECLKEKVAAQADL